MLKGKLSSIATLRYIIITYKTEIHFKSIPGIFNGPFQNKGHCGRALGIFGSLSRFGCVSGIVLASQVNLKHETKQDKYKCVSYMPLPLKPFT